MNWHYKNNDQVVGPLSDDAITELHACGVLADETLVRREGTEEWLPFDKAFETGAAPPELLIKFHCPHCDIKISAESADAGASVNCPSCGNGLIVPTEPTSPPVCASADPANKPDPSSHTDSRTSHAEINRVASQSPGLPDEYASEDDTAKPTFGASLASFAKSAAHEVKLNSQIAVLKTRIENAKQIELRKAHYALGRKFYEARILLSMQDEIEELERQIAEKGERAVIEENETKGAMLKRVGKNAAKTAESELLSLKLKQSLTNLGELARKSSQQTSHPSTESEMEAILLVESKIQQFEKEVLMLAALRNRNTNSKFIRDSLASEQKVKSQSKITDVICLFFRPINIWLKNTLTKPSYIAVISVLLVVFLTISSYSKRTGEHLQENFRQERVKSPTTSDSPIATDKKLLVDNNSDQSQGVFGYTINEAVSLLSPIYPNLSKAELIEKLEKFHGKKINSYRDAKVALRNLKISIDQADSLNMSRSDFFKLKDKTYDAVYKSLTEPHHYN